MDKKNIERIEYNGQLLALIIRKNYSPNGIEFLTSPDLNQQIGAMSRPAGYIIKKHIHKPSERRVVGTSEFLIIKNGTIELYIYNNNKELARTLFLKEGDMVFLVDGGHGIKIIEDAVIIEIKQGPYSDAEDKERF